MTFDKEAWQRSYVSGSRLTCYVPRAAKGHVVDLAIANNLTVSAMVARLVLDGLNLRGIDWEGEDAD